VKGETMGIRIAGGLLLAILILFGAAYPASAVDRGAVLRSAVLPGWGQLHLGHSTRGYIFLGIEIATWTGAGLSYLEGVFERDDFRSLAMEEAGIDASDRPNDFLNDLADFSSSDEYNSYIRRLARYYYPDDPEAQNSYYAQHARYGTDGWNWSSESARLNFADAHRMSREWFRRSMYIAAFAIVNRAVSAIDAALLDESTPGVYTSIEFPDNHDFSSVRFTMGARF
jgi:hypothetical protein